MEYNFRKIEKNEVNELFELIKRRMRCMDEQGIKQWNVTDYTGVYPLSHFEELADSTYVFVDKSGKIACGCVLLTTDERWKGLDAGSAFYVHHLVSEQGTKCGAEFMRYIESVAKAAGKEFLRLDSADDNEKLEAFYSGLGFTPVGHCIDGAYFGTLREKRL